MTSRLIQDKFNAFLDGPDRPDISNPIHSTSGANDYGYSGALVGGATVFGWATDTILRTLGDGWLATGWASISFRRPTYPGEELLITLEEVSDGEFGLQISGLDQNNRVEGSVGIGVAPWLAELTGTEYSESEPVKSNLETLHFPTAPLGEVLRPLGGGSSAADAISYANEKQHSQDDRFIGDNPVLHPGWICARPIRFLRHSYDYSPAIHARSEIQFFGEIKADEPIVTTGTFVDAYQRKGHSYAVVDCSTYGPQNRELVRQRHTTIFEVGAR